ncbi:hypothetical protein CTheo_4318 [Ceratobasidium theobromae]|uniref:Uncharacterized protein n=1 Tax=Ceratobasidium theobromae TaxID=1582974 RepID=A0A5N5QL54_9AGAM|nr:hypothetical protein CTheo_4318 [Ceratobasidium theobromae]
MRASSPTSERHLSITDSIVSTTAEEIRERFQLNDRPRLSPRRDSALSQWTADESLFASSAVIRDFPRPPMLPALPSPTLLVDTNLEYHSGSSSPASRSTAQTRFPSPSSQYLVPSPRTESGTGIFTHENELSPSTAAFLRSPVRPPSTHASHEQLLDPGFIRTLMSGIDRKRTGDGLSLDTTAYGSEGPFGDRHASLSQSVQYSEVQHSSEAEDVPPVPASSPRTFYRRAPAASLPSSPRSSFSFSVRSGVIGRSPDDPPDVPPLPAAYRQDRPPVAYRQPHPLRQSLSRQASTRRSFAESGTGTGTGTGAETETEETGIVQQAIRTSVLRPVLRSALDGPYAGSRDLGSAHARTTSADLAFHARSSSADLDRAVRNRKAVPSSVMEEGDDLVYATRDDLHTRDADSYLDSPYIAWADPASPNEITPALRDSMVNDTASYMRRGMPSPSSFRPRFKEQVGTPSTAPATPGHGGYGFPATPNSAPLPGEEPPRKHARRISGVSFVSSVFSKFSGHASAGHNSSTKGFSFALRGEVPPVPTLHLQVKDDHARASVVKREGALELPALAHRAEQLNEMLELGKLPYRSKSTLSNSSPRVADVPVGVDQEGNDVSGEGYTDEKALKRNRSLRSVFTTISDRSRRFFPGTGSASLRSSVVDIPGQQNLRFNKLPEEHRAERKVQWGEGTGVPPPRVKLKRPLPRKKILTLAGIAGLAIVAIVGVAVGITRGKMVPDAGGFACSTTNRTGNLCDLDAACVCTSAVGGQCNPLAQSIADLVAPVNRLFDPSPAWTPASVALALWEIQGSPLLNANCANQAVLVDVGPALSTSEGGSAQSNRTQFARSALLWTLVESMDTNGTAQMQRFIQGLDFSRLDGPNAAGEFLYGAAGYQVDFGRMTVSQPAVTWVGAGRPSDAQVGLVGNDLRGALDRVYTFASGGFNDLSWLKWADFLFLFLFYLAASSAQRSTALARYWTNTLQLPAAKLSDFRTVASSSPVLLPFDADSSTITPLFSSPNQSFPPPLGCWPGLAEETVDTIDAVEVRAFGLSAVSSAKSLDSSCFSSRPVYGVLDIARTRLGFVQDGAPKQAVRVASAATSRVAVRLGRALAGVPTLSTVANQTGLDDTRTYGTLNLMDHVLLAYLEAFPSTQAAAALVDFVLGSTDAKAPPPSNTSALYNLTSGMEQVPVLEVAFFGTVGSDDLDLSIADFATKSGELFFGSANGDTFRSWATNRTGSVVWSDGPLAAQVVRESTLDRTFEEVWKAASTLLSNAQTAGTKTSRAEVGEVVSAFGTIGYMGT